MIRRKQKRRKKYIERLRRELESTGFKVENNTDNNPDKHHISFETLLILSELHSLSDKDLIGFCLATIGIIVTIICTALMSA